MQHTILASILIYGLALLLAIALYTILLYKMQKKVIAYPPKVSLLLVFIHYLAWIIIILQTCFLQGTVITEVVFAYLVFISPFIMLVVSYLEYKSRKLSLYHQTTFVLSLVYSVLPITLFLLLFTTKMC